MNILSVLLVVVTYIIPKKGGHCSFYFEVLIFLENKRF